MNFATLQGLTIPEGVVTQIESGGVVLWMAGGGKVILEVEKITSDTYAAETTYTAEEFILLDIYPKTNGTVSVTYGGLTKTITDTSGAEEPNAQQVFFGTFNGVSDSVATPASGELTIEGDYYAFGCSKFDSQKSDLTSAFTGVSAITNFGSASIIPQEAFGGFLRNGNTLLSEVNIPSGVKSIGAMAFGQCTGLTSVAIPASVESIGYGPFCGCNKPNFVNLDTKNSAYKIDGNCLIELDTQTIISAFNDSVVPSYIKSIADLAFLGCAGLTNVVLPEGLVSIGKNAFTGCTGLTSLTIPSTVTYVGNSVTTKCDNLTELIVLATTPPSGSPTFDEKLLQIIVPKGCGEAYKAATGWKTYADRIVEAS